MWDLRGTERQNAIVEQALALCDFPFERLAPSLEEEDKTAISVEWEDLSRYGARVAQAHDGGHAKIKARAHQSEVTEDGEVAHPIERVVDGRRRVLGLFYLPPHTRIVLDTYLEARPVLAREVFLAEAAHAVDYHWMTATMRRQITNVLHQDDLPLDAHVGDGAAFELDGHTCSWFDVGPYEMWVGEAFMESFVEAFARDVTVTIQLAHPTGPVAARAIRGIVLGVQPTEAEIGLSAALERIMRTTYCPDYLREAASEWLWR